VPGCNPAGFTLTVTEPDDDALLDPDEGDTFNQLPPEIVDAEAEKFTVPAPELRTVMDCGPVALPPTTALNVNPDCVSSMIGCVPVTTATTEITNVCPPVMETVTVPEYVPGANCDGSAVTERDDKPAEGIEPEDDESASQFPPDVVLAEAVNSSGELP
jgi:hypothetical protein